MTTKEQMLIGQQVCIAALAEVGYRAEPHPNGSPAAIRVYGQPPCAVRWKASTVGRLSVGRPVLTFAEWHELCIETHGTRFHCDCGGDW